MIYLKQPTVLPRFFGVEHVKSSLADAKAIITRLPKGSKVGLEMDFGHPDIQKKLPGLVKQYYSSKEASFFFPLAEHAKKLGHVVVWLETPSSWLPPHLVRQFEILEQLYQRREMEKEGTPRYELADLKRKNAIRALEHRAVANSPWRSQIMARIVNRHEWKETDVTLTGTGHALALSDIFHTQLAGFIGSENSEVKREELFGELREENESFASFLNFKRRVNKFFRKIAGAFRLKKKNN